MVPPRNLAGKRFGKITVVEESGETASGNILWKVRCDCGREYELPSNAFSTSALAKLNGACQRCKMREPITFDGKTLSVKEWAAEKKIPFQTLVNRLGRGWSIERALTQPLRDYPRG